MLKHVLTLIWNQRRANGWIFAELLLVVCGLWVMMDSFYVNVGTYVRPMGYDIRSVYRFNLNERLPGTKGYVSDSLHHKGDDLIRIIDNLRREPLVESVGVGVVSCPYTWQNSWNSLMRADRVTDSTVVTQEYLFQLFRVDEGYFDVLRIKDTEGRPVAESLKAHEGNIAISSDLADKLFPGEQAVGKRVKIAIKDENEKSVTAVTNPIRADDFVKSEPCYYLVIRTQEELFESVALWNTDNIDLLVRMKGHPSSDEMDRFMEQMGDALSAGNLYVVSVNSLEQMRPTIIRNQLNNLKSKVAIVAFMLVNVFFGIVGTFWLRTGYRRGEIGLRMAMGSTRAGLKRWLMVEGLCLLLLTLPFAVVFFINMFMMDMPDTYRMPYDWVRFAATFLGSYLLMGGMICLGIWFPARKSARMNPAEALHYE